MESVEIQKQLDMTYDDLVCHLLKKYGVAQYDYFLNETCRSKNLKVTRTSEGLLCHHIDEDKAIWLSNSKFAIKSPFEYQKADRLVYCNVLEHLILHIKIVENFNNDFMLGIGGAINFMIPEINDYFNGYKFKDKWMINVYNLIENNFDDYIIILKRFLQIIAEHPIFWRCDILQIDNESLSRGKDKQIVKKVYEQIKDFEPEL